jgi:hypothetical protein
LLICCNLDVIGLMTGISAERDVLLLSSLPRSKYSEVMLFFV